MDPNACLDRLLTALGDNDTEEAVDAAADLAGWLRKGGFAPRRSAYNEIINTASTKGAVSLEWLESDWTVGILLTELLDTAE